MHRTLVLVAVLFSAMLACQSGQFLSEVVVTVSPKPSATLEPTSTLTPQSTPTRTPAATPTIKPVITFSAAELDYRKAVKKIMDTYALLSGKLSDSFNSAADYPSLLLDSQWKLEVATAMALIKKNGADLRKLKPPTRFTSIHADLVDASTHYDKAMDLYAKGLDAIDADKMEQAAKELKLGSDALSRAIQKADALQ